MVTWLESNDGRNFNLITGQACKDAKGIVAGKQLTVHAGYSQLADFVNGRFGLKWTAEQAGNRYKAMVKNYRETKHALLDNNGEKFCVGPDDNKRGIYTIEKKLEHVCWHYERLDALFGERPNINPPFYTESGLPSVEAPLSDMDSLEVGTEPVFHDAVSFGEHGPRILSETSCDDSISTPTLSTGSSRSETPLPAPAPAPAPVVVKKPVAMQFQPAKASSILPPTVPKRPLDVAPTAPSEVPPEPKKRKTVAQVYEKRCEAELEFKKESSLEKGG